MRFLIFALLLLAGTFADFGLFADVTTTGTALKTDKKIPRILVLFSSHASSETRLGLARGFYSYFPEYAIPYSCDTIEFNALLNPDPAKWRKRFDMLKPAIEEGEYDAVVAFGMMALETVADMIREKRFPEETIFIASSVPDFDMKLFNIHQRQAVIYHNSEPYYNASMGLNLFPETKNLIFVTIERFMPKEKAEEIAIRTGCNVIPIYIDKELHDKNFDDLEKKLAELTVSDSLLISFGWDVVCSEKLIRANIMNVITSSFGGPVFCAMQTVEQNVVGGVVASPEQLGRSTAEVLKDFLAGTEAMGANEINPLQGRPYFNPSKLEYYDIPLKKLPAGSILNNKSFQKFFEENRIVIYRTANILIIVTMFVTLCMIFRVYYKKAIKRMNAINEELPVRVTVYDYDGNILYYHHEKHDSEVDEECYTHIYEIPDIDHEKTLACVRDTLRTREQSRNSYRLRSRQRTIDFSYLEEDVFGLETVVAVSRDTTELLNAQLDSEMAANRLKLALRSIADGLIMTDRDMRVKLINSSAARITGYSEDSATGIMLDKIMNTGNKFFSSIRDVFKKDEKVVHFTELHLENTDGTDVIVSGNIAAVFGEDETFIGAIIVFHDVTIESKRAVQLNNYIENSQIIKSCLERIVVEMNFNNSVEHILASIGIPMEADRSFVYEYSEEAGEFLQRYSWQNDKNYDFKMPEKYSSGFIPLITRSLKDGRHIICDKNHSFDEEIENEINLVLKNYSIKSIAIVSLRNPDGSLFGFIGLDFCKNEHEFTRCDIDMIHDAASLYQIARERNEQLNLLEETAQRAEAAAAAKSMFIAAVSHELRTPLNAVIGFSELLRSGVESEKEKNEYLDSINYAGKALLNLINDVLDLSKIESGRMVIKENDVNVETLINEMRSIFSHKVKVKKLQFETRFLSDVPTIKGDEKHLRQILLNIIGNAVKFTDKGGVKITVSFIPDKNNGMTGILVIDISDTGIGITEEYHEKIFDPFVQDAAIRGSRMESGTGLGLPISKRLAEAMNGAITIESSPGKGSVFKIILNEVKISGAEKTVLAHEHPRRIIDGANVLIVDDIAINSAVLGAMLLKMGSKNSTASSAKEALIKLSGTKYDFVFTDLWMDEMDGAELAAEIRKRYGNTITIIAVTADAESSENFDMSPFDDIIMKPITIASLKDLFENIQNIQEG